MSVGKSRTVAALIRRGIDPAIATRAADEGFTIDALKKASKEDLERLGLRREDIYRPSASADGEVAGALARKNLGILDRFNRWSGVVAAAGLAAALLTAIVAVWAIVEARNIASESGSLMRPSLRLALGGQEVLAGESPIFFVVSRECASKRPALVELPLAIFNTGKAETSDVQIALGFPLLNGASMGLDADLMEIMSKDGPPVAMIDRVVADSGNTRYVSYRASKILPGMMVRLGEILEAPLPITFDASEVTDGKLHGDLNVSYSVSITFLLTNRDGSPLTGSFSAMAIVGDTPEDYLPQIEKYIQKRRGENSEKLKGVARFHRTYFANPKDTALVLMPESSKCNENGSISFTRRVGVIEYARFSGS